MWKEFFAKRETNEPSGDIRQNASVVENNKISRVTVLSLAIVAMPTRLALRGSTKTNPQSLSNRTCLGTQLSRISESVSAAVVL